MIEKTLTDINYENMELLQRRKEIMKLQSELIKETKLLDTKLHNNIVQKLQLEKRKMIILPNVQVPVASNSEPSRPENSVTKSPCIIKRAKKSLSGYFGRGTPNVAIKRPLLQDEVPDSYLLEALGKIDENK